MASANDKNPRQDKVKLKATNGHPHFKAGEVFEVHPVHEKKLRDNKWAVDADSKAFILKDGEFKEPLSHAEANGEGSPNA